MSKKVLCIFCRVRTEVASLRQRLALGEVLAGEEGLSKLAITVILVAVGVGLTLAVVSILGPKIVSLAERTGTQIDSVPLDWGR